MDWASLGGIALALIGILIGESLGGGRISSLLQPSAFIIVTFGTFGAVLLQSRPANFRNGFSKLKSVFTEPEDQRTTLALDISQWSLIVRKEGVLKLESYMNEASDPFVKKILRLVIDGAPPQTIKEVGANDLYQYELHERNAIKVWDSAGGYAPTIGILAAVMGLIHVMENLSDPTLLGSGIAVAFVSTIYGVGLANLLFIPIANKLKTLLQLEVSKYEMVVESLASIAYGEHTKVIEDRLSGYLL
ncbi:flagellar motor protein [Polynucleobacter sp. CS-Odin-A6]|uniref:flagellar motor protein n=1 Tax=Polynucleobacter sp. CS-Odin-A6 TaxID=2689106 RepID=UPI001C0BB9D2|nr:flagellar motor protein [Polynucleobacter sp. CS-Odin-A6]MBU3621879.1 flagellar motor protein [Polynucleobacter sp. CS-Odin-A6]